MLRQLLIFIAVIITTNLASQTDSVALNEQNFFYEGIYLSYKDFRNNNALQKESINTKIDKEQLDFYFKVTLEDKLNYTQNGNAYTIETKKIWGLVQNKTLYININGSFFRVPVFGQISYFAAVIEVAGYYNGIYDPMFGPGYRTPVKTKEVKEFILNYHEGIPVEFNLEYLELLLKKDEDVYKQFMNLNKRNRKKQATRYIRMFNERHAVYYFKN